MSKRIPEIEREIKDLEIQKAIEQLFSDGKITDGDIEKKGNELQNLIQKMVSKRRALFVFLLQKMEG
jgi:ATP-binding cassette subfamily F protein uup